MVMGKASKICAYSCIFVVTLLALRIDRDCTRFCNGYGDASRKMAHGTRLEDEAAPLALFAS